MYTHIIYTGRIIMESIAIANRKGGVGKTATSLNLAAGLHRQGKRTLLIDIDPQCCLTKHLNIDPDNVPTIYDVISGEISASNVIIKTTEEVDLIPGSPELSLLERTESIAEDTFKAVLKPVRRKYDYIIVDCPPGLGNLLINALTACTDTLITAEAKQSSLDAVIQLNDSITAVKQYSNKRLKVKGILITMYKPRTRLAQDMRANLEDLAAYMGTKVFDTEIRECNSLGEAEAMHQSIFRYAPKSNAAKDYNNFINEILQEGDLNNGK